MLLLLPLPPHSCYYGCCSRSFSYSHGFLVDIVGSVLEGHKGRSLCDGAAEGDTLCIALYVEGGLCLMEVSEVMRRVLLCMLKAMKGELCLLEALEMLELPEGLCCMLFCTLEVCGG